MNKLELYYPIKPASLTQSFGGNGAYYQSHGVNIVGHNGLDFVAFDGQEVYAAHDGIVTYSGEDSLNGEFIEITSHEEFDIGGITTFAKTIYVHFQHGGRKVETGNIVNVGQVIGYADSTGLSTGTHLHFGLKRVTVEKETGVPTTLNLDNGYNGAINPKPFLNCFYACDAKKVQKIETEEVSILTKVVELETLQVENIKNEHDTENIKMVE